MMRGRCSNSRFAPGVMQESVHTHPPPDSMEGVLISPLGLPWRHLGKKSVSPHQDSLPGTTWWKVDSNILLVATPSVVYRAASGRLLLTLEAAQEEQDMLPVSALGPRQGPTATSFPRAAPKATKPPH